MFPDNYMPHALRGMMLITIENQKAQSQRDYRSALSEYEIAGNMIRSSDETTYYDDVEQEVWRFDLNTLTSEFLSTVSAGHITEVGQGYVICHDFNGGSELQTVYY
jgi:hypothetical protein